MRCAIWHHPYNLKSMKNTHGGVLILVRLQAKACKAWNFAKINATPWVFFTFLKFYRWYQIVQRITFVPSISYERYLQTQSYMDNMTKIVNIHRKKTTTSDTNKSNKRLCNFWKPFDWPLDGNCQSPTMFYFATKKSNDQ